MESKLVSCSCGTNLKIPVTLSGAKAVKCPKCGSVVNLTQASPPSSSPAAATAARQKPATDHLFDEDESRAKTTKPCQFCGETIQATAVKCRHCGEFLDAAAVPARAKAKSTAAVPGDEPNAAEYFVAIVLAPVGLIIGLVWMLKKQAKYKRMFQASGLSFVIIMVAGLLAKLYFFDQPHGPEAPVGGAVVQGFPPGAFLDDEDVPRPSPPPRGNGGSTEGFSDERVDLEGQPPHIQRAMRANVRIETQGGIGSGVVLQRNGDAILALTNRHVIDNRFAVNRGTPDLKKVPSVRVSYFNEQRNPGKVIWIAPDEIDLALVEAIAPKEIEPVTWSVDAKVLAGQEVFAVGNPLSLGWSFSKGVVSAVRQTKRGSLDVGIVQTDAKITYGNSGGGLYKSENGELIGINTFIADPRMGAGLGFALRPQVLLELKPQGLTLPSKREAAGKAEDGKSAAN